MNSNPQIVIVGVGALGSHVVLFGRNLPVRFTVVDFDRVERKNTLSQFHSRMGVGRNKAQALGQAMQGLFGMRLDVRPHRLTEDNVGELLREAALVVDCVDNAPTRQLIQTSAEQLALPCVHGALAPDGAYARIMWREEFAIDGGGEGQATCEDGEHLPFIATVAARMTGVIQRFLKDGTRLSYHIHPGGLMAV